MWVVVGESGVFILLYSILYKKYKYDKIFQKSGVIVIQIGEFRCITIRGWVVLQIWGV
jgi:hypothetical protein